MTRRFRIVEPLGAGGMGLVYRAQLTGPEGIVREVALKLPVDTQSGATALREEARALGAIRHAAVPRMDGLVSVGGRWALVMEYVEGIRLTTLVQEGAIPVRAALDITCQLAGALDAAHHAIGPGGEALGLIHRDVKPSNVVLTRNGDVKLLDFGVAKPRLLDRTTGAMRRGSLPYLAPERHQGFDGPEGDVYALAAVIAELLTGEPLGPTAPDLASHTRLVDQSLKRVDATASSAVPGFVALLSAMMAFDPSERPTMRSVERECDRLREFAPGERLRRIAEAAVPDLLDRERRQVLSQGEFLPIGTELVEDDAPRGTPSPRGAWTPSTPTTPSGGSLSLSATPSAPVPNPLEIVRRLLANSEPDTMRSSPVRRYEPDTGALEDRWLDDGGPFRALAWFAALGLVIAIGLALFVALNGARG